MEHPAAPSRDSDGSATLDNGPYRTTCWTAIVEAAGSEPGLARAAFGRLYQDYWQPVYGFVRRQSFTHEEAEDLAQSFFLDLLSRKALRDLRPELGRFRCFLVASLRHFLGHARERARARKRGGDLQRVGLDEALQTIETRSPPGTAGDDTAFDREWAWTVLRRTLDRLRDEHARCGRAEWLAEVEGCLWGSSTLPTHAEIARRHGITANAVGVALHRLQRRFGRLLREEVARTVRDPADVREELRHLLAVLEQGSEGAGGSAAQPPEPSERGQTPRTRIP